MAARCLLVLAFCFCSGAAAAGPRLDAIMARGHLNCGVSADVAGFSIADADGAYSGFEADLCRAISAAIFGEPKVEFVPATTLQQFLQSPDIDLVLRALTWTFRRETGGNVRFGPTYFYDGQTLLVRSDAGYAAPSDLAGETICASQDVFADFVTPLRRYFDGNGWTLDVMILATRAEAEAMFFAGECEAMTADATELASAVIVHADNPGAYRIMDEQFTKEPIAPLLHRDDEEFFDIVSWTIFALVNAEEIGLTSVNIDAARQTGDPDAIAFLDPPAPPGFAPGWTYAIVKHVGNFGELYERHVGTESRAKLARGLNRLWTEGGLLYAPPLL